MHTHTGYKRDTNGWRGSGLLHGKRGACHALNGSENIYSGGVYTALCGEAIQADHDGHAFNVAAVGDTKALPSVQQISCKRCKRKLSQ